MTSPQKAAIEWVSFVDDSGETWLFDLSFFRSNWQCIYGQGCEGIEDAPDDSSHLGCCSYGAHFTDEADVSRVLDIAGALPPELWQHHHEAPDLESLTTVDDDGDRLTRVVDGACVFLNGPDFETGPGCALHIAAIRAEIEPLEWKPEVCWQLPLRVEHHLDDNDHSTHMVRQWTRRDWGESGEDFGWWCAESPKAFTGQQSVARYMRAEVSALAGEAIATALIDHIEGNGTIVMLPR